MAKASNKENVLAKMLRPSDLILPILLTEIDAKKKIADRIVAFR